MTTEDVASAAIATAWAHHQRQLIQWGWQVGYQPQIAQLPQSLLALAREAEDKEMNNLVVPNLGLAEESLMKSEPDDYDVDLNLGLSLGRAGGKVASKEKAVSFSAPAQPMEASRESPFRPAEALGQMVPSALQIGFGKGGGVGHGLWSNAAVQLPASAQQLWQLYLDSAGFSQPINVGKPVQAVKATSPAEPMPSTQPAMPAQQNPPQSHSSVQVPGASPLWLNATSTLFPTSEKTEAKSKSSVEKPGQVPAVSTLTGQRLNLGGSPVNSRLKSQKSQVSRIYSQLSSDASELAQVAQGRGPGSAGQVDPQTKREAAAARRQEARRKRKKAMEEQKQLRQCRTRCDEPRVRGPNRVAPDHPAVAALPASPSAGSVSSRGNSPAARTPPGRRSVVAKKLIASAKVQQRLSVKVESQLERADSSRPELKDILLPLGAEGGTAELASWGHSAGTAGHEDKKAKGGELFGQQRTSKPCLRNPQVPATNGIGPLGGPPAQPNARVASQQDMGPGPDKAESGESGEGGSSVTSSGNRDGGSLNGGRNSGHSQADCELRSSKALLSSLQSPLSGGQTPTIPLSMLPVAFPFHFSKPVTHIPPPALASSPANPEATSPSFCFNNSVAAPQGTSSADKGGPIRPLALPSSRHQVPPAWPLQAPKVEVCLDASVGRGAVQQVGLSMAGGGAFSPLGAPSTNKTVLDADDISSAAAASAAPFPWPLQPAGTASVPTAAHTFGNSASWSQGTTEGLPFLEPVTYGRYSLRPGVSPQTLNGSYKTLPQLPWLTCSVATPQGQKAISGVLYRTNQNDVYILCACHGRSMQPADFMLHADIASP